MRPGYATMHREVVEAALRTWDYGVEVVGAETVEVIDDAPGDNSLTMRDTPRSDALTAEDDTAELRTAGIGTDVDRIARAVALAQIQAISASQRPVL